MYNDIHFRKESQPEMLNGGPGRSVLQASRHPNRPQPPPSTQPRLLGSQPVCEIASSARSVAQQNRRERERAARQQMMVSTPQASPHPIRPLSHPLTQPRLSGSQPGTEISPSAESLGQQRRRERERAARQQTTSSMPVPATDMSTTRSQQRRLAPGRLGPLTLPSLASQPQTSPISSSGGARRPNADAGMPAMGLHESRVQPD